MRYEFRKHPYESEFSCDVRHMAQHDFSFTICPITAGKDSLLAIIVHSTANYTKHATHRSIIDVYEYRAHPSNYRYRILLAITRYRLASEPKHYFYAGITPRTNWKLQWTRLSCVPCSLTGLHLTFSYPAKIFSLVRSRLRSPSWRTSCRSRSQISRNWRKDPTRFLLSRTFNWHSRISAINHDMRY